jgi:hypothetical protein
MAAAKKQRTSAGASPVRRFKDVAFAGVAQKVGITDQELCKKARDLIRGVGGENLGGGVWKVRLRNNDFRALVLTN